MRTEHKYNSVDGDVIVLSSPPPPFVPRSPRKRGTSTSRQLWGGPTTHVIRTENPTDVVILTDSEDEDRVKKFKWKGKGRAKEPVQRTFKENTTGLGDLTPTSSVSARPNDQQSNMAPTPLLFSSRVEELDDHAEPQVEDDPPFEGLRLRAPNQDGPTLAPIAAAEEDDMNDDMHMAIALSLEEGSRSWREKANNGHMEVGGGDKGPAGAKRKGKERARTPFDEEDVFDIQSRRSLGTLGANPTAGPLDPAFVPTPATSSSQPRPLVDLTLNQPLSPISVSDTDINFDVQALNTAPPSSPRTIALIHILEIIPNIQPEYVQELIETEIAREVGVIADAESQQRGDAEVHAEQVPSHLVDGVQIAQRLVGELLEETGWPKVEKKGKGKRKSDAAGLETPAVGSKKPRVDWKSRDRVWEGGMRYIELALIHLQTSFPLIPKAYLRRQLQAHNSHYAPTHIALTMDEEDFTKRKYYTPKKTGYRPGRDLITATKHEWKNGILDEERKWIKEWDLERNGDADGKPLGEEPKDDIADEDVGELPQDDEDEDLADGEGIECQCCFTEYSFSKMVQCPEAHLFCSGCVSQYAASQLGSHNPSILCMHSSGCAQPFPVSELRRILSLKIMELYDRVKQQKEIEEAELDDLEECPFCEYKCVIDRSFEEEKLFRCGNEDGGCGVVSCRQCKKEDHLPKSCAELEEDKHLDGQHAIEEAMTRALMRNCPKCKKPFIKEYGCNKMTCPNCHTYSCYVCRQIITGYDHFDQRAPTQAGPSQGGKCMLSDSVEQRHADEVKAAAAKAIADLKESHPDANADKIKIDIPGVKQPQPRAAMGGGHIQHMWAGALNAFNVGAFGAIGDLAPAVGFGGGNYGNPWAAPLVHLPPAIEAPVRGRRGRQGALPRRGRAAVPLAQPQHPMLEAAPPRPKRQKRGRA